MLVSPSRGKIPEFVGFLLILQSTSLAAYSLSYFHKDSPTAQVLRILSYPQTLACVLCMFPNLLPNFPLAATLRIALRGAVHGLRGGMGLALRLPTGQFRLFMEEIFLMACGQAF